MNYRILLILLSVFSFTVLSKEAVNISVKISDIPLGENKRIEWRGYPVYIFNLNKNQQDSLLKNDYKIGDDNFRSTYSEISSYFNSEVTNLLLDSTLNKPKSTDSNIIVLFGVSPESLCMFIVKPSQSILEDPCVFSTFSYDGRPLQNSNKQDFLLLSPPYKIESGTVIILNNTQYERR